MRKSGTINKDTTSQLESEYRRLSSQSTAQILDEYHTQIAGLDEVTCTSLLETHGRNVVLDDTKKPWYVFLFTSFTDEFILILLALAVVSVVLQDRLGALIIMGLAVVSAVLRFTQDYNAYLSSEALKTMIHTHVDTRREDNLVKVDMDKIVPGDIVELGNGSIVPADLYIIQSKDLFVSQSMFTGESVPVEKKNTPCDPTKGCTELENICLMGCNVMSGSGIGVVVKTGKSTYLGQIAQTIESDKGQTNFERGINQITKTLMRYMIGVVVCVFFINGFIKKDWLQALMFAVSVAVGITPGMLPMIVNATLSKGAQFLAKKKTIVKNISAIQNLGAIDVLCTDKTGTLTVDNIELQLYMNFSGVEDQRILEYAFLNSYFSTGIKNLIDNAIIAYGLEKGLKEHIVNYKKIDEIPFDYNRKRMSIVIENTEGKHRLITKGAPEEILKICTTVREGTADLPITEDLCKKIIANTDALCEEGMHVIAIAQKHEQIDVTTFNSEHETGMTFIGYVAFLDPPKPDVAEAIKALYEAGVDVKVLTGDAPLVVRHICKEVGMRSEGLLTGTDIEAMTDEELREKVTSTNIFARLAPMQKQRVVDILRSKGHVVGYMGDGVNDAPSLRHADVGISVDSATDIAKESSDIILLEKNLMVLKDGIYEGRRIYGNIMKYIKMALSGNFGNIFSVLIASIFLPFLPMIPIQMLLQNLVYDFTQATIPWDNVDEDFILSPKKWDIDSLTRFMNVMGITSSVFDILIFSTLWFVLGYSTIEKQAFFQTGWFIEGLVSQILIVHFIRTSKIPFVQSIADFRLLLSSLAGVIVAIAIPFVLGSIESFNFTIMPIEYYFFLIVILFLYFLTVEIIKKIYIKKTGGWL